MKVNEFSKDENDEVTLKLHKQQIWELQRALFALSVRQENDPQSLMVSEPTKETMAPLAELFGQIYSAPRTTSSPDPNPNEQNSL